MAKKSPIHLTTHDPHSHIAEQLRPLAVAMDRVHLDPKNAREHSAANLTAIAASLREFGQVKPIVANRQNSQIEAGNGTYLAAQTLGWSTIAVVWVDHDSQQQRGFSLADNRTAELANWNQQVLDELLAEVRDENADLYSELLLADLEQPSAAPTPEIQELDEPLPAIEETTRHTVVLPYEDADVPKLLRFLGLRSQEKLPPALGKALMNRIRIA